MRMKTTIAVLLAVLALGAYTGFGSATVNWSFLSETGVLVDNFGAPLSPGDPAVTGDGTIVQLLAWVGAEAWGSKIPDIDMGNPADAEFDPNYVLIEGKTVGDGLETFPAALAPGRFSVATAFDPVSPVDIQGKPMIIRFWDETAMWYNELTKTAWVVPNDGQPAVSIDVAVGEPALDLASLLGNPNGVPGKQGDNYSTAILVPEPSTILLLGAGLGALLRRKRG